MIKVKKKNEYIHRDVAKEILRRLFSISISQVGYFTQLHLQNSLCLCFPEQFETVVSSFSASDIPAYSKHICSISPEWFNLSPPPPPPYTHTQTSSSEASSQKLGWGEEWKSDVASSPFCSIQLLLNDKQYILLLGKVSIFCNYFKQWMYLVTYSVEWQSQPWSIFVNSSSMRSTMTRGHPRTLIGWSAF